MATQPMKTLTIDNVTYEIVDDASRQRTGELSGLNTDTKTNIVAAINEHETQINNTYTKSQVDTKIDELTVASVSGELLILD